MEKKKILVTSALPYVNNVPHLGNIIGSVLSADVFARFNRSIGNDTLFICGTDEHGTATENKAVEEGLSSKQICDKYYKIHKEIYDWFNISFDIFGRTSTKKHEKITQDIFKRLYDNKYIFEDEVEQLFCIECNRFLADRFVEGVCPFCGYDDARGDQCDNCGKLLNTIELKNPRCKIHGTAPILKKTKHLFIDLKKLQPKLIEWVNKRSRQGHWTQNAVTTTKAWFKEGLKKRAITRDLEWGVPVPLKGFEDKVFYVWFDAPIGYISITAQFTDSWEDWWKNPDKVKLYQFMAKDNIPFHTIVFPAVLLGTSDNYTMLYHINSTEYLNYEDGKFSKSRNIGIFGDNAKESNIPSDAYRYYLLINRPEQSDAVFSWEDFFKKINNELVANLGNFVNRVMTFIDKYLAGNVEKVKLTDNEIKFLDNVKNEENKAAKHLKNVELKLALKQIFKISQLGNQFFQDSQPWKTIKDNKEKCKVSLYTLVNLVKDMAVMIEPFLPETSKNIFSQLNIKQKDWQDLGKVSISNHKISKPKILFKKLEQKQIEILKKKFSGKNNHNEQDFSMLNLKIGRIVEIKKHPKADKLYIEKVDLGTETRQIVSGLVDYFTAEQLLGKNAVIVTNLAKAKFRGEISEGMLLAAEKGKDVDILTANGVKNGAQVTVDGYAPSQKEISYKEFSKIKMKVIDSIAAYEGKPLHADSENIRTEKLDNGNIC